MANLQSLAKDTAIYGMSSIVGRFLNYLLVPLYTNVISSESGGYGVVTNLYGYTALILAVLTFGMETTFFRFANKEEEDPKSVFVTSLSFVAVLTVLFMTLVWLFIDPICERLGYSDHHDYVLMMASVVSLDALQAIPFSYLRFLKRPIKFAGLKLLFIFLNIGLNLIYFLLLDHTDVWGVFAINCVCTTLLTFFFLPELFSTNRKPDMALMRRMFSYSWPVFILSVAGILNQTFDKIAFPLVVDDKAYGDVQLGIYGACVKIAMIMALITQAFRYAYEPIVFAGQSDRNNPDLLAKAMKFFIIFTLLAFLCVVGYLDVLKFIIGQGYREGLKVVPIVMVAEIMMGVYFNLSFWYKLIDKTIWGAWFSLAGCAVLMAVNVLFIPRYGYMACAWGGVAGYGTAMVLSYLVGQRYNPISYPMKSICAYVAITALFYCVMTMLPAEWPVIVRLAINTVLIVLFVAHIIRHDMPLSSLPVIGKRFKK